MTARRVLVVGGGDVGSAVAHELFLLGMKVLVSEREHSAHSRRGMAFTDALFDGSATLEGVCAKHVATQQAVEQCWQASDCVPVVTLAENLLIAALHFDVVVDATMRREDRRRDLRGMASCTVGLGPGYEPGINCHIAIETQWGPSMGQVLRDHGTAARAGGPHPLDGIARERFVVAPLAGVWRTGATLGQLVRRGDVMGHVGADAVRAPLDGHLRGLTRDGVEVRADQRVIEVDPRAMPELAGLGERPRAIALGVAAALGLRSREAARDGS
jgi:xanthine dehydrogenase accessory factor